MFRTPRRAHSECAGGAFQAENASHPGPSGRAAGRDHGCSGLSHRTPRVRRPLDEEIAHKIVRGEASSNSRLVLLRCSTEVTDAGMLDAEPFARGGLCQPDVIRHEDVRIVTHRQRRRQVNRVERP